MPLDDTMAADMRAALTDIENPTGTAREAYAANPSDTVLANHDLAGDTRPFRVEISKLTRLTGHPEGLNCIGVDVGHIRPAMEMLTYTLDQAAQRGEIAEIAGFTDDIEDDRRVICVWYSAPAEGGDQ